MEPQEKTPQQEKNELLLKRELLRKSLDKIMVYNPTDTDYVVEWDGFKHIVPNKNKDTGWGKGKRALERYLAEKYVREMKNKLITEKADSEYQKLLADHTKKGTPDALFVAQTAIERRFDLRTDNAAAIKDWYAILWLGVVEKYGLDDLPEGEIAGIDLKTSEEKALEGLENLYVTDSPEGNEHE